MTNEEIIFMAKKAGGYIAELPKGDVWSFNNDKDLKRFAYLIAAREREACENAAYVWSAAAAKAIRARGQS